MITSIEKIVRDNLVGKRLVKIKYDSTVRVKYKNEIIKNILLVSNQEGDSHLGELMVELLLENGMTVILLVGESIILEDV